jgi:serine/threonine protein kinase
MSTIDEEIRRRFESDWKQGRRGEIADYLPAHDSQEYLATLEELICIDMEFRWAELASPLNEETVIQGDVSENTPKLETYLDRFPGMRESEVLQRLVDQEIRARKRSHFPPEAEEYQLRFPELNMLPSAFRRSFGDGSTQGQRSTVGPSTLSDESLPRDFGKYRLLSVLGKGGMGTVYRAWQETTDRSLAIKIANVAKLDSGEEKNVQQRFEAEMRAAAKVSHDNLMPIYDVGVVSDCLYYTMPILDGDLASEVRQHPLPNRIAAEHIANASRGVAAAHANGLLHRDIKPHNLMFDREKGRVVVADFGLVRWAAADQQLTMTGEILGTPPYMSPEQIQNAHGIDARADVYALGATLYHLLVGRPPFIATSPVETLRQVLEVDPVLPRLINPEVDADLETICIRCLQKDPELRFSSANDLANDLARHLRGEPIQSRPLGSLERLARWRRRNPVVAALTMALVFSLAMLSVVAGVGWYSSQKQLARVVANSRQGQASLNELFTFVRTEPLLDQPGQESVRRHLLERGLEHYESLMSLAQENQTLPADMVAARAALGQLTLELHGPEAATDQFRQAIAAAEKLPQQQQNSPKVQIAVGDSWNGLGQAQHRSGEYLPAVASFDKAIELRRVLVNAAQDNKEARRKLANAIMNRGLSRAALGEHDEARKAQNVAQIERHALFADTKEDPKLLRDLAQGEFNLARLDLAGQNPDQGQERLRSAMEQFRQLTEDYPTDVSLWQRYIECLLTQALFNSEPASSGVASPLSTALEYLRPLVMLAPDNRTYRLQLISLYQQAIEQQLMNGEAENAQQAWTTVQDKLISRFDESDSQPDVVRARLMHLRQSGLIALGVGDRLQAKQRLLAAVQAWKAASSLPQNKTWISPQMQQEWDSLQHLADSLDP